MVNHYEAHVCFQAAYKAACHANPEAGIFFAGSSLYILRNIFLNFLKRSANNNVSLWEYKSWYSLKFLKSLQNL